VNRGVRALGLAESAAGDRSATVAGAVVHADRTFDGLVLDSWTVGGTDATATVVDCWEHLDREDVRYVIVAGIAPAWFNLLDLHAIHEAVERPVLSVSFEESRGWSRRSATRSATTRTRSRRGSTSTSASRPASVSA
jgi:endonuclease V-like protein UPF0215 family